MRLVEALLVIIALVALVWAAWSLISSGLRARAARWEVRPHSTERGTAIYLEKPEEEPFLFRELARDASDEEVEEALIDAQLRADSFNATLGRRSRLGN